MAFELEVVTLGLDQDGDPVTSCTIRLVPKDTVQIGTATDKEQTVLEALEAVQTSNGGDGATKTEVFKFIAAGGSNMKEDTVRTHLRNLTWRQIWPTKAGGKWSVNRLKTPSTTLSDSAR